MTDVMHYDGDVENPILEIPKPWGKEVLWAASSHYAGKILFVKAGGQLSLQYHDLKDETLFLIGGSARLYVHTVEGNEQVYEMHPERFYRIGNKNVHRLIAITDSIVLECSTPHLNDVVRLEDVYDRPTQPSQDSIIQSV